MSNILKSLLCEIFATNQCVELTEKIEWTTWTIQNVLCSFFNSCDNIKTSKRWSIEPQFNVLYIVVLAICVPDWYDNI